MREFLGAVLVLSAFAMFVLSIVVLVKPLKELKLGTRARGLLLLVASFVVMGIGGAVLPPPSPEDVAAREAKRAQESAEREKARATEKKARDDAAAAKQAAEKVASTAAASQLWTRINSTVAGCDAASKAVADAAGARNPSPYVLYPLLQRAESICRSEGLDVGQLDIPDDIPARHRDGFKEALETCSNAYLAKMSAFGAMAEVLDGNVRPSAVSAAQEGAERAQAGVMLCGIRYMKAANDAGLELDEVIKD